DPTSWSGLRAVTITVEDDSVPGAGIGGEMLAGGWRRGVQGISVWGGDSGGGIRYGETSLDGARVALTEYPCAKALIGSEWRGTQMRPCELAVSAGQALQTANFSDGPHSIGHCVTDFAGNVGCTAPSTVLIDNNPPAHPRGLALSGGESWRRTDDFDLTWANPDQGPASPIGGASWRILGPAGFDTGVKFAGGRGISALNDLSVPLPGLYTAYLWLRDEAGNESGATAVSVSLRLDNVAPGVAFEAGGGSEPPEYVRADVSDAHSGPAGGEISYRRLDNPQWTELPTKLQSEKADSAKLIARVPELSPGTYVFRAVATDGAGNSASSTRRADGTEMALRKVPEPQPLKAAEPVRGKTRVFARLGWRHRLATDLTIPFRAGAFVTGRLTSAEGAGLAGRELRVVSRPSHGALGGVEEKTVGTGPRGGFRTGLPAGPSRRVTVSFAGDGGLERSRRPSLALRVRGGLGLRVSPRALRTGQVLKLRGRVRALGAPLPRRGKLVAIQYLEAATHRWRPVLVTRSDHSGAFRAHYRFRYVTGVASIRLRATALAEDGWPYAPGSSRPVTVRVRG
ncbi:MAG TPA: fibronectin type III domain-containing protein, partial [Trebonia sp.]|nr:fibronectin type III domain-containing protein [Trebonia sp.]